MMSSEDFPDDHDTPATVDDEPAVTLETLHEELVAGSSEARRGNRRTLEVLKNFGTVLDAMSATVNDTHKAVRELPATGPARQPEGDGLPREWELALIELADRIGRVAAGFDRPPAPSSGWWPGGRARLAAWREAWEIQADAIGILRSHLGSLLTRAGLERLETLDAAFDPATMTAVESAEDRGKPDHTVLAELLPGWRRAAAGELVRPAQVRVSRHPKTS